jgi:hypothetical protein
VVIGMQVSRGCLVSMVACGLICLLGYGCGGSNKSQGSPSVASSAHRPPQNDDYISTYGKEAEGADRQAIISLVTRYYAAAAADDGATACTLLYSTLEKAIPEDYGRPPGPPSTRGKTCPVVLRKFFKHPPRQPVSGLASTKVTGVRIRGSHAFVQLTSKTVPTSEISVQREGTKWKIETLIGEACKNCAAS